MQWLVHECACTDSPHIIIWILHMCMLTCTHRSHTCACSHAHTHTYTHTYTHTCTHTYIMHTHQRHSSFSSVPLLPLLLVPAPIQQCSTVKDIVTQESCNCDCIQETSVLSNTESSRSKSVDTCPSCNTTCNMSAQSE